MEVKIIVLVLALSLLPLVYNQDVLSKYEEYIFALTKDKEVSSEIREKLKTVDPLVLLQMFDASSKLPDGILGGNFFGMGNFDECYGIQSKTEEDVTFYGKYCLAFVPIDLTALPNNFPIDTKAFNLSQPRQIAQLHPEPRLIADASTSTIGFRWGVCLPSFLDVDQFLFFQIDESLCYSKATEPKLSAWAIASIVILGAFLCLVISSTIYDICLYYTENKPSHELLIAFSFLSNGRKLFASTSNPDQLLCLNGLKAISMMWVILGHVYSVGLNAPLSNLLDVGKFMDNAANMFLIGATVSVDTFFTIGGLVTVYTFMKATEKGVKFNIFLYYIHRILRLTPAFAIMAMVYANLITYLGHGPLWFTVDLTLVQTCAKGWWSSLLYIGNYVQKGFCLPQTWYLSVDMQLFVLSPLVLIPLSKWRNLGLELLGILTVLGVVVPAVVADIYHLSFSGNTNDYMLYYYMQTHARFGPYVIGMILGYFIFQAKKSKKNFLSPILACCLWFISLAGLVACVYAGHHVTTSATYDRWGNIFYIGFNRPAWAVALSIMIFLCVTGYGGPINSFLSIPLFQFLSKVSYSMYLVHYAVVTMRYASLKELFRFSNIAMMQVFWGDFMFTLAISVVLCLTFESPVIIIEKHIFGRGSRKIAPVEKKAEP